MRRMKRKLSDQVDGKDDPAANLTGSVKKRAVETREMFERHYDSEQIVKEFKKLVNVKETRLKGLIKLNKTLKLVEEKSKCAIILGYLKLCPDCNELFKVLEDRIEERSLLEVQLVLEILETIILHLAEEEMTAKSKSTVLISIFLNKHRKLVYNLLNSSSPAKVVTAMLKLLTAFVMQGSTSAKELLNTIDFSHKTFRILANRRDKEDVGDVRTCFIKFLLAFFISGDPSLIQQVIHIKGFATSIFKNLYMDSPEIINLVLSTLLVQIVQNPAMLKKTKILLFTSHSLTQLAKLYNSNYKDSSSDSSVQQQLHNFLLESCASSAITFENKLGILSFRSNNPVLLRFLNSLPKTLGNDLLIELIIKTLVNSPDLITPYLLDSQMALEPRNSEQWLKNFSFLTKLYILLPSPSVILNNHVLQDDISVSKLISLVSPLVIKRNILTKGLVHSDAIVQITTLEMMNVILERSVDLTKCSIMKKMVTFLEELLKILPSLQTLISIRENLLNTTSIALQKHEEAGNQASKKDIPKVSVKDAKTLLSKTLVAMNFYQLLWPASFSQISYDVWKVLPRNDEENVLYNLSSQQSMLEILLNSSFRNFQWQLQARGDSFQGLFQILQLYCTSVNSKIKSLSGLAVQQLFFATGVFDDHKKELDIWLRNLLEKCGEGDVSVIKFVEKVYKCLANDPCDFVDIVLDCVNAISTGEESASTILFKKTTKTSLPFSPLIAAALKVFKQMKMSDEQQEKDVINIDPVDRFLNLVLLEFLSYQADPRPLYYIVTKYLTDNEIVTRTLSAQTRNVIYHIGHWCPVTRDTEEIQSGKRESLDNTNVLKQLKKQFRNSSDDPASVVKFLKCNPVSLLDLATPTDLVKFTNTLPCSVIIQQLLFFLSKYWDTKNEIEDMTGFKQLSSALLSSVKNNNLKDWKMIIANCMFFIRCLVQLYLKNSENHIIFVKTTKIITEVLGTIFHRVWDSRNLDENPESANTSCNSVEVGENNDVIGDVYDVSDPTTDYEDVFLEYLNMVFGESGFQDWFCSNIGIKTDGLSSIHYISCVLTDCTVKLIDEIKPQIVAYSTLQMWKPYFVGIAEAVKFKVTDQSSTALVLPFNVHVSSLVKVFGDRFSVETLSDIIFALIDLPKQEIVESRTGGGKAGHGNILTEKGKTFVTILNCFFSDGKTCLEICSTQKIEQIFNVLVCLDCQETDDLISKYITIFSNISDQTIHVVLAKCLKSPSRIRLDTIIIILSSKPRFRSQFEEYLVNCRKQNREEERNSQNNTTWFLQLDSQWELFLPLLNFYLASVIKENAASRSKTTRICLNYIAKLSWSKLTKLLLQKPSECSTQHIQLTLHLVELEDSESDTIDTLFNDIFKLENTADWNMYYLQVVETLLQYILTRSSNKKHQMKHRTIFVFACLQKTLQIKSEDQEPLRLKILSCLENYGKGPLKLKVKDCFTSKEFVNVINTFIKFVLRSHFSCHQSLRVLSVIINIVYTSRLSDGYSLLLPLTDIYQFILSHSKFLEVFLGSFDEASHNSETKNCLVDLLQTVVNLDPKCCHPSHVSLILGAYSAKLHLIDQKLLCLLFSYETALGELTTGSQLLWGEAAIETYEANKNDSAKLFHQPNISEVLELLDSKLLLQSSKQFPIHKQLKPVVYPCKDGAYHWYDPSFLLPLFSFLMSSSCEVDCKRFIDRSGLAYTMSSLTSTDQHIRQIGYQILSRFLGHLSASKFKEKQQVVHLLHCFQNGIVEPNPRISSLIVSFMTRALHIFFYPEDPLYVSVNSYMLRKAFFDLRDVPLFLSLINSSDLGYRNERIWLIHLLIDGLRDSMDYYCCKKYHVFEQLFSLYNCSLADKHLQTLILKVVRLVSSLRDPIYDLCHNYGLVPWLHMLVSTNCIQQDTLLIVLDILSTIWFTLIGQDISREGYYKEIVVDAKENPLPKNISSELLLVCLSVVQRNDSSNIWNQDSFESFVCLFASLLEHQNQSLLTNPTLNITKQNVLKLVESWKLLHCDIDIVNNLISTLDSDLLNECGQITSSKWLRAFVYVARIFKTLPKEGNVSVESDNELVLYSCITKPFGKSVKIVVENRLRSVICPFLNLEEMESSWDVESLWRILKHFKLVQ